MSRLIDGFACTQLRHFKTQMFMHLPGLDARFAYPALS